MLNFARGELVDDDALLDALNTGRWRSISATSRPRNCWASRVYVLHAASGRKHPGKRDQLRRDGRRRAERLPQERQHRPQRQPRMSASPASAAAASA